MNLDLDAVASLFGESRDLADLEWRLNDPYMRISNLDLNYDGYVDYLRLIEVNRGYTRLIIIQAVIGPDLYQDIATIEVSRDYYNHTSVQIVGNSYLYGNDYIVEPVYVYAPVIYNYFWGARYYQPYYSHYRWGHYPHRYRPWRPVPVPYYNRHVRRHINKANRYRYTTIRKIPHAREMHRNIGRNDYMRLRRNQPGRYQHPNRRMSKNRVKQKRYNQSIHRPVQNNGKYNSSGRTVHHYQRRSMQQHYDRNNALKSPRSNYSAHKTSRQPTTRTKYGQHKRSSTHTNTQAARRHYDRQSIQSKSLRRNSQTAHRTVRKSNHSTRTQSSRRPERAH